MYYPRLGYSRLWNSHLLPPYFPSTYSVFNLTSPPPPFLNYRPLRRYVDAVIPLQTPCLSSIHTARPGLSDGERRRPLFLQAHVWSESLHCIPLCQYDTFNTSTSRHYIITRNHRSTTRCKYTNTKRLYWLRLVTKGLRLVEGITYQRTFTHSPIPFQQRIHHSISN